MKKSILLIMLMAFLTPWTVLADEVTVCDGTATSSYAPFNSLYADYGTRSQFIIPADSLSDLAGGTISAVTFYTSTASATYDQEFTVYLQEVENETFASAALEDWDQMEVVYVGSFAIASNELHIDFDSPFAYQGGNLMVGVQVTQFGSTCPTVSWRGVNPGSSVYTCAYNNASSSHVWSSTVNRVAFIPKMTFAFEAGGVACEKPSLVDIVAVAADGATIEWADGSGVYNVQYKKASEENWTTVLGGTSLLSTDLTDLTPATAYQVRVQSVCDGDSSLWKSASFVTECAAITTYPWSENFEGCNANTSYTPSANYLPLCWGYINECTYSSYKWYPLVDAYSSSNPHSGSKYLRFYSSYSSYSSYDPQPQYAVLPEMYDLDGKQLVLYARGYNATSSIIIGRMADPFDTTTFSPIMEQLLTTTYAEYEFNLAGAGGDYIAIKIDAASSSRTANGAYIDDIVVRDVPSCLKPTELVVYDVTTNSAELGWTEGGSESAWALYYKKSADSTFVKVDNVTENPYTLSGLDGSSAYQFYVVAKCDETDISEPSAIADFFTDCEAIATLPWSENFDGYSAASSTSAPSAYPDDDLPICWQFLNRTATSSTYPQVFLSSSSSYVVSGNCLFFKSSSVTPLYAILPEFAEDIAGLQLTFTYRNEGTSASNGTLIVGYMTDPMDTATFVSVLACPRTTTLTEKEVSFVGAPAGSFIVFKYEGGSSNNYYLSIDNVSVAVLPSCPKPSTLAVSNITSHTAVLGWNVGAEETAWQIMLNNDTANIINADANPYTLTGLAAETAFVAKVRANCGGSYSEWSTDSINFTTLVACPAPVFTEDSIKNILAHTADLVWGGDAESYIVSYRISAYLSGFSEDFEGEFDGWTLRNCAASTGVSTGDHHSGSKSFRFYYNTNPPQYLISPMLSLAAGDSLRFWYKNHSTNYPETFQVGYSSTDDANDSFVFGEELTASDSQWHQFVELVPAGTKYICWKYNSNDQFYLYIDDVEIGEVIPAGEWTVQSGITANGIQLTGLAAKTKYEVTVQANCGDEGSSIIAPAISFATVSDCQTPSALAADSLTTSSAVISWETYGLTSFNLRYGTDGENWTNIAGVSMPYKITGLSAGTEYQVQVQAVCNTEAWSAVYDFKTVYAIPYAPVAIDGEDWLAKSGLASSIFAGEALQSGSTWSIAGANEAFDADHLRVNNYGASRKDWAISPEIDATGLQLAAGEKLKLSFTVALAKYNYGGSVATLPDTTGIDDKFIVAFSIDNGATWSAANATEWSNAEGAANIYNYIPNTGMDVSLDFSAAAGHIMRFAFYAESTINNADNDIHVGNIVLEVISNTTDIKAIEANDKAVKFIENGHIYILRDGAIYDAVGRLINK